MERKVNPARYKCTVFFFVTAGLLALLMATPTAQSSRAAGPWYVAPGGDDILNNCLDPGTACATINGAIAKASPGDTIYVASGTYTGTSDEVVLVDKDVTLSGGWDASFITQSGSSTIDGQSTSRGITVDSGVTATIERFIVQNGSSSSDGGGVYSDGTLTFDNCTVRHNTANDEGGGICNAGDLTLINSVVTSNAAYSGGGIDHFHGTLTLNNSTVSDNTARGHGGGIHSMNGDLILENSIVRDNTAYDGGGIDASGRLTVANSIVSSNIADNIGGGILSYGILTLDSSSISGNKAGSGGGVYNVYLATLNSSTVSCNSAESSGGGFYDRGTNLILNNSTLSGNEASNGGGIYNYSGTVDLNSSTVSDNTARSSGGGIAKYAYYGTVTLQNTILAGNVADDAPDCLNLIGTSGYNLIGDLSGCTFTPGAGDQTDVSANLGWLIGPTASPGYHPLLSGSPAIDAGNPAGCTGSSGPLLIDQRGAARVGHCDIGAYEYTTPGPAANIYAFDGTLQRTPPNSVFWMPLQALVLDGVGSPVNSVTVTFSAPMSGASGTFSDSGAFTTTAVTGGSGIATAAPFTANGVDGSYVVSATVNGVVTSASFSLSNLGWYVTPTGDNADNCQTSTTACATINGPLEKAGFVAGDTVLVAIGTYTGTGSEVVLLGKNVRVAGGWDGTFSSQNGASIIDGEDGRRGITVGKWVTAIVEYLVVQKGYGGFRGGGVYNNGTLTVNDVTVRDSYASRGGGFYNSGTLTLNSSTVSGNRASNDGGGIQNTDGTLNLNSSTVSDNMGGYGRGGIRNEGDAILQNTIVAGNTFGYGASSDCSGEIDSLGYNLIGNTSSCTFSASTGDLLDVDARLFPLIEIRGYHPLLPGSPAIDAGNPAGCTDHLGNPLDADQRRVARVGRCDIGAYEFDPANDPLTYVILPIVIRAD